MAQVEYYFSRENLCQDSFLVSKMDSQHFVDVSIIADFKMVKQLTTDTELILSCVANSDKVSGRGLGLTGRGCGRGDVVTCGCHAVREETHGCEVVNSGVGGGVLRVPDVRCGVQRCSRRMPTAGPLFVLTLARRGGGG